MVSLLQLAIGCSVALLANAACPSNEWRPFKGKCYYASTFDVGGWSISDVCNFGYPGSKSVSIHDIDVNSFLAHDMLDGQRAWMGLYRRAGYSGFHWEDESPLDWTFWSSIPTGTDERCANINQVESTGQWGSLPCGAPLRFLCETFET
ncbi:C-type lectin domain family 4 member A-like [Amphibalanus amphitrite]|uniref:C-type lectin domain family 4 member A-like n=1 Tax=Amphibalanus amphitrite TaxID=1232801 RepID=UPI001C9016ED|nr:C-type lectin domain family 4 member A-like [Amphibalanus amphitrite]